MCVCVWGPVHVFVRVSHWWQHEYQTWIYFCSAPWTFFRSGCGEYQNSQRDGHGQSSRVFGPSSQLDYETKKCMARAPALGCGLMALVHSAPRNVWVSPESLLRPIPRIFPWNPRDSNGQLRVIQLDLGADSTYNHRRKEKQSDVVGATPSGE